MAKTYLDYPFDEEIFNNSWQEEPDPVKTALLESGVMVADDTIEKMISNGSNLYTIPFYDILSGDEGNYDAATDIPTGETSVGSQKC